MKPNPDVYKLMQKRLLNECRRIHSIRHEMDELASAYLRYLDLKEDLEIRRHSTSSLLGLFGPELVAETKRMAASENNEDKMYLEEILNERDAPDELRDGLRLWRAVREYVRLAGESSIGDIQNFLDWVGIKGVTRQAIESALHQHRDKFEVAKRGSEKFVALK